MIHSGTAACSRRAEAGQHHAQAGITCDEQRYPGCACRRGSHPGLPTQAVWNARARYRKSTMLPSCGCNQLSWIVGMAPKFSRSMF